MNEDRFLQRLREDARSLQHDIDSVTVNRAGARIRARLDQPVSVSDIIVAWIRPLAASLTAIALAAVISYTIQDRNQLSIADLQQYSFGGEAYSAGE